MKTKKDYLAIAETLQKKRSSIINKAHRECLNILRNNGCRMDFSEDDVDYDVTMYEGNKTCSLRSAYVPAEGRSESIILDLYCYDNKQTYTTNSLNTDIDPINLLLSLAGKLDSALDFVGRYTYQVEEIQGNKLIHVDGYVYRNEGHYDLVQACGCYIPLEDLRGKTEAEVDNHIEDAFSQAKQYQGEISEEEIRHYYDTDKKTPLAFSQLTEETPCGFYMA